MLFDLLLIDMHCNYTRTGCEVHACIASSHHVRKKLVNLCKRIFMVQCHPQNIFNIQLFPKYSIFGPCIILWLSVLATASHWPYTFYTQVVFTWHTMYSSYHIYLHESRACMNTWTWVKVGVVHCEANKCIYIKHRIYS